jgi:hypothetical protein
MSLSQLLLHNNHFSSNFHLSITPDPIIIPIYYPLLGKYQYIGIQIQKIQQDDQTIINNHHYNKWISVYQSANYCENDRREIINTIHQEYLPPPTSGKKNRNSNEEWLYRKIIRCAEYGVLSNFNNQSLLSIDEYLSYIDFEDL